MWPSVFLGGVVVLFPLLCRVCVCVCVGGLGMYSVFGPAHGRRGCGFLCFGPAIGSLAMRLAYCDHICACNHCGGTTSPFVVVVLVVLGRQWIRLLFTVHTVVGGVGSGWGVADCHKRNQLCHVSVCFVCVFCWLGSCTMLSGGFHSTEERDTA